MMSNTLKENFYKNNIGSDSKQYKWEKKHFKNESNPTRSTKLRSVTSKNQYPTAFLYLLNFFLPKKPNYNTTDIS